MTRLAHSAEQTKAQGSPDAVTPESPIDQAIPQSNTQDAPPAPPPIWLPVGPQLRALARRRTLRDFRFWAYIAGLLLCAFLVFGPAAASLASGRLPLTSPYSILLVVTVTLVPLWIFNCRAQAIAAEIQRTLPITVCRGCLYDTAAVPTDRCPECGAMIANTMPGVIP